MKKKHSNGPRGPQSLFFCHLHEIRQLIDSGNGYAYIFEALSEADEKIRLRYLHDKKRGVQSLGRFFERKNSKEAKLSTQVIEKKQEENTKTEQPITIKPAEEDKTLEPLTSSSTSIWDIGDMKVVRETEEELKLREEREVKFLRIAAERKRREKEKEEILKNQKKESN